MWYRYGPYVACIVAGAVLTLVIQVSWRYGNRMEEVSVEGLDLTLREDQTYRVLRVVDGDTLALENGLHVRYAGVNTPEKGRFVSEPAPLSEEATARNRELVEGREVRLRMATAPLDAYGRVVAHITVVNPDGSETDVETVLLEEGLARVMGLGLKPGEYERLKALQESARSQKRGIWGFEHSIGKALTAPYCASSGGKIYHRADCSVGKRISPANRIGFQIEEEARSSGRQPCQQCLRTRE